MFKNMTIGKKIGCGFGVIMALLAIVVGLSYRGVGGIVTNASEVIGGNQLDGNLAQKEVDHLNWANKVSALLTDEHVTHLDVETDDHKCAFGQWLFGEERKAAQTAIPSIAPMLKEIEGYHAHLHESAIEIGEHYQVADVELPGTLCAREVDHLDWADRVQELFLENQDNLDVQTDPNKCAFGVWLNSEEVKVLSETDPQFARYLEEIKEPHRKLHESAIEIQRVWRPAHAGLIEELMARLDDHRKWAGSVCRACVMEDATFDLETNPERCAFGKFLASDKCQRWCAEFPELKAALDACRKPHERLHHSAIQIKEALASGDVAGAKKAYVEMTVPALDAVAENFQAAIDAEDAVLASQRQAKEIFENETTPALKGTRDGLNACRVYATNALEGMERANHVFASKTKPNLEKVQELLGQIRTEVRNNVMTDEAMLGAAQSTKRSVTVVGVVAIVVGVLLALVIARGIVTTLTRIITGLNEGADQVNDAALQVSAASQQLAEGASEQASSLEETSAALEEMAAMTKTNADNAKRANDLSDQARTAAQGGDSTMAQLNDAMVAINESSGQISKIIKVIEEIAFQTNLLALNAAVEAARAGEHGKGFAVVADEVRNLAQRAAQAARETTGLIEDSVTKAKEGADVASSVGEALTAIVGDVTTVSDLIEGISKASQEQAQGVDQVNTAVSQMDKVTQMNASGAEESASAAEQLSAQAATVKTMVDELSAMVRGANSTAEARSATAKVGSGAAQQATHKVSRPTGSGTSHKSQRSSGHQSQFPMDDDKDNLNDF